MYFSTCSWMYDKNIISLHTFHFKDLQILELKSSFGTWTFKVHFLISYFRSRSSWLGLSMMPSETQHITKKRCKKKQIIACLWEIRKKKSWFLKRKEIGIWAKYIKTISGKRIYLTFPLVFWYLNLIVVIPHQVS